MNAVVVSLLVVVVLALLVLAGIALSRGPYQGQVNGPGGIQASVSGDRRRGLRLRGGRAGRDYRVRGTADADARDISAGRDVDLNFQNDPQTTSPKAPSPTAKRKSERASE
jgi:hypothetical protein